MAKIDVMKAHGEYKGFWLIFKTEEPHRFLHTDMAGLKEIRRQIDIIELLEESK